VVSAAGVAAAGASTPPRPGHYTVTGGSSKITLNKSTRTAMASHGYTLTAISPATFNGKTLKSPIKGGTFTLFPEQANIRAAGGFTISHGGKHVSISKVRSTTNGKSGSGTARVRGHGRIKSIITGQPKSLAPGNNTVSASGFSVKLAKPLIKVLDNKFGTTLFKSHARVGKGSATFNYK
jgi:hypothetical protein